MRDNKYRPLPAMKIYLSGQFHGAVYVKSTLSGVINNISNFGGASQQFRRTTKKRH